MITKPLIILTTLFITACTSNNETTPAASEPVAPESAELTDKPTIPEAEAAPAPTTDPTSETAEQPAPEKSVSPPLEGAEPPPAAPAQSATQPAAEVAGDFFIAVSHLNVRSGPGMANSAVEVLTFNTSIQSQGIENRIWVKIGEGRYVSKNYLSEQKLSQPMQVQVPTQQPTAVEAPAQTQEAPAVAEPAAEMPATQQPSEQVPAETQGEAPPPTEGSEG
jgi:hypothetical protein